MPNNDWYEYTSEEMQHLGEEPGDILGLIIHDGETESEQGREKNSPQEQKCKLAMPVRDKLKPQASHTYRDWQALLVLHVVETQSAELQQIRRGRCIIDVLQNRDLSN